MQISTKLNRSHLVCGRHRADPADARAAPRSDVAGQRPAVRHRRGLGLLGARLARPAAARRARTCAPRSRSSPGSPRPPSATGTASTGGPCATTTGASASTSRRVVPGCESYEVNVRRPGRLRAAAPAARLADASTPKSGRAEFAVSPDRGAAGAAGARAAADAAQPRPVQHHDLRASATATAASRAAAGWCSCTATTSPRSASTTATWSTWSPRWDDDDRERVRAGVPDRRVRHPARLRRRLLPGDQPAGAAGLDGARRATARLQVGGRGSSSRRAPAADGCAGSTSRMAWARTGRTSPTRSPRTCPSVS